MSTGGGATVQVPVSQLHHRDVSEAGSRWYGQQHAFIPDTQINDRLRQPIESSEVIHELPPLDAALRQQMETLNQRQQRVWAEQPLALRADEQVVGIATDGSRRIVAGPTIRILGKQGETIGEFPIKLDRNAPAFLADQHRKLAGFVNGKLLGDGKFWFRSMGVPVGGTMPAPYALVVTRNLRGQLAGSAEIIEHDVSELFLEHLKIAVQNYQWQHGGDLQERGELLLRRWSERAPQSAVVAVLRGIHHQGLAWDARGSGFADTVGQVRFEIFNEQMRLAVQANKPALEQEHSPTRAFMLVFDAAMSLNQPLETVKRFHSQMMDTPAQWSPPAHTAVVLYLLPRWHGNPGDSERYISAVANRLSGDGGDAMYTHLMLYAAQFYPRNEPASNHLAIDFNRVLKRPSRAVGTTSPKPAVMRQAIELFQREQRDDLVEKAQQVAVEQRIYYVE